MLNGDGYGCVIWFSGCELHCEECQNPQTWSPDSGVRFTGKSLAEICEYLEKDYVDRITFSGGNPLHPNNREMVLFLVEFIRAKYPHIKIWLYSGYDLAEVMADESMWEIVSKVHVYKEGRYVKALRDTSLHWFGSSNQNVIDIPETVRTGVKTLWNDDYKSDGVRYIGKCGCGE